MPEIHLRQPEFTYSACRTFAKMKERVYKFKGTGDSRYIYQNELDKYCFQHDMPYGDFKDLTRRAASNKMLHDKAFNFAKNKKRSISNVDLLQWSINFLIRRLQVRVQINLRTVVLKMKTC